MLNEYSYNSFWETQGKVMKGNWKPDSFTIMQEGHLRFFLDQLQPKSVLELGAGFGRVTGIIKENYNVETYKAVDISSDQLSFLHKDWPSVQCRQEDITTCAENAFGVYDLVISVEFLMHIKPEHIEKVFHLMNYSARYHIINLDYNPDARAKKPTKLAKHNFTHDYPSLYESIGRKLEMQQIFSKQAIFCTTE